MSTYWPVGLRNWTEMGDVANVAFQIALGTSVIAVFTGNALREAGGACAHFQSVDESLGWAKGFQAVPNSLWFLFLCNSSYLFLFLPPHFKANHALYNGERQYSIISITSLQTREVTFDPGSKPARCEPLRRATPRGYKSSQKCVLQIPIMLCDFTRRKSLKLLIKVVGSRPNVCSPM